MLVHKMNDLLIFIPQELCTEQSGYMLGKVIHDERDDLKKFYVISLCKVNYLESIKSTLNIIGYYSNNASDATKRIVDHKYPDWIRVTTKSCENWRDNEYYLTNITLNNKRINPSLIRTIIVLYDYRALQETELFHSTAVSGDHFYQLAKIIQSKKHEPKIKSGFACVWELVSMYHMFLYLYPVLFLSKMTEKLLPILKYSSLGLHVHNWLENVKWMLVTVMRDKGFKLKTGNYALAIAIDMALGIFTLQLLQHYIDDKPSQLLLNHAEKVVHALKDLINWLMGVPAGLKLNHALSDIMGKFFLYHIQLWWTFLIFSKPLLDLGFEVLLLFGRLGITFQISIVADLLALLSFHTYCIYVYAARLFNIQLKGITALFRLFLGKKKNPLRERVDSCQYQTDQLFIGTLSFTILLFLMPTTWIYYTVFTLLRLVSIGLVGFLTRLKFYLQIMPVYIFWKWLLRSYSTCSIVDIRLHPRHVERTTILLMTMVVAPWKLTWKKCIPDTIVCHPSIEWCTILNNILWGQLLYPL